MGGWGLVAERAGPRTAAAVLFLVISNQAAVIILPLCGLLLVLRHRAVTNFLFRPIVFEFASVKIIRDL